MASQAVNVDKAIQNVEEHIGPLADLQKKPDEFVRGLHRAWKSQGGKVSGKPRHSEKYLEEQLKSNNALVRSLIPKLKGKTALQPNDALKLVNFFLRNWPEFIDDVHVQYAPLVSERDILLLVEEVQNSLKFLASTDDQEDVPGTDIEGTIVHHYSELDALITVSSEHTLIVAHPRTELIGFRNLINKLHEVDEFGNLERLKRPLIWVLDLGFLKFDDVDLRMKFLNVAALVTRFKALQVFKDPGQRDRWAWLCQKTVIVLLDWTRDFDQKIDFPRPRPDFSASHVSISDVKNDLRFGFEIQTFELCTERISKT